MVYRKVSLPMSESQREYRQTRKLPLRFEFENGPTFIRDPLIYVVGGYVLTSWSTESDRSHLIYRQPADQSDMLARGVCVLTSEFSGVPAHAGAAIADVFTPDEITGIAHFEDTQHEIPPIMLLSPIPVGAPRPGKN